MAAALNELISKKRPIAINSSWILRHAPASYRFIQKWVRSEIGGIDWDRVTNLMDRAHQKRWRPRKKKTLPYRNSRELRRLLSRFQSHLYVFISPVDGHARRMRDTISIAFVRLAQRGNVLAKKKLVELIEYTVDQWIEGQGILSRWRGYVEKLRDQIEACIRRYRYTGSFIHYLYKTLEYAARDIRPLIAYSLDDPLPRGNGRKLDALT